MTGRELLVETRRKLDAAVFATDGAGALSVSVADPSYTDAEIEAGLNAVKSQLWDILASRASDHVLSWQDTTYTASAESVRISPPGGIIGRPVRQIVRLEDRTSTRTPWPIPRINFHDMHLYRSAFAYPTSRKYAERGGNLFIVPIPGADLPIRLYFIADPARVIVTSLAEEEEVPRSAFRWLIAEAARDCASKFGKVPEAITAEVERLRPLMMSALSSREEGPSYGRWTRGGMSSGLE